MFIVFLQANKHVQDLNRDLRDGDNLITLLELLSQQHIVSIGGRGDWLIIFWAISCLKARFGVEHLAISCSKARFGVERKQMHGQNKCMDRINPGYCSKCWGWKVNCWGGKNGLWNETFLFCFQWQYHVSRSVLVMSVNEYMDRINPRYVM